MSYSTAKEQSGGHTDTDGHSDDPTWNYRAAFTRTSKGFVVCVKRRIVSSFVRGREEKKHYKKMDQATLPALSR